MATHLKPVLKMVDLVRRLTENKVDFVVIGGVACVMHGGRNITEVLDVCSPMTEENLVLLLRAMEGLDPRFRMRPDRMPLYTEVDRLRGIKNLCLQTKLGQFDLLGEVAGVGSFEDASRSAVTMHVEGVPTKVLGIDALIRAKLAAGRPKDLSSVDELESIKRHGQLPFSR